MKKKINNVLFIGSKELGLCTLKAMHALSPQSLAGVITFNDSQDTRTKLKDFRKFTQANKIPFYVVENNKRAEQVIKEIKPDLCFLACWYWFISEATLNTVPFGFVIMHNSLLPKYRGASPLVWAMMNEEPKVGFSLFVPGKGMDDGPVYAQGAVEIGAHDYIGDVLIKLERKIEDVMRIKYPLLLQGSLKPKKQNSKLATYCAQRVPDDGIIDWTRSAKHIYRFIRVQSDPFPGAFTYWGAKRMKIWRAKLLDQPYYGTPGQVAKISHEGVYVTCGDHHAILLEEVQIESKRGKPQDFISSIKTRFSDTKVS